MDKSSYTAYTFIYILIMGRKITYDNNNMIFKYSKNHTLFMKFNVSHELIIAYYKAVLRMLSKLNACQKF